jgi:putative peptidoglycan lipid II flippase
MVGVKVLLVLVTNAVYQVPAGVNPNVHPSPAAVEWLNISTSVSYIVGAIAGHVLLTRRLGRLGYRSVAATGLRMSLASVAGGLAAWAVVAAAHGLFGHGHLGAATGLIGGSVVGLAVLAAVCVGLRFPEVRELRSMAGR